MSPPAPPPFPAPAATQELLEQDADEMGAEEERPGPPSEPPPPPPLLAPVPVDPAPLEAAPGAWPLPGGVGAVDLDAVLRELGLRYRAADPCDIERCSDSKQIAR
eukprot:8646043-Pyramimonas_sp.AAC.1